jgi:hypothetical protein
MINSFYPIRDRVYFLKDGDRYVEYRYTERGNASTGTYTKQSVPSQTDTSIVQKLLSSMTLPNEREIWNHTPESVKNALLFSYAYHEHHKNNKVANVEISNWLNLPYFANLLTIGQSRANIKNIIHPRAWFNAVTMTNGNHKQNLRIGHIHFTYDVLPKKKVYAIHWDIGASRFSRSILVHWIFDDMSS